MRRYHGCIKRYRQPVLIYNPYAGRIRRDRERILQATTAALTSAGCAAPRILPTDAAGHATSLAREAAASGADLALVLGGDGTINEAANGLANSDVPLGVLPGGTANVLAHELGLSSRLGRALQRLPHYQAKRIALGRLANGTGERYFVCMAGAGVDAKILTLVDPVFKDRAGQLAYWSAGMTQLWERLEPLDIRVNGCVHRCGFALASRVRNYGGDMEIARGASLDREDFEIVLFEGTHPLRYVGYLLGACLRQVQKMPGVRTLRARCAEIVSSTHVQIDGEYAWRKPSRVEIAPEALTMLMPPPSAG
jgi:diacylglycerol kinase (ATP)